MRASAASFTSMSCITPLLARKVNRIDPPLIRTCWSWSVVNPNDLLARAYSLLPILMSVFSSSLTTVASTNSRESGVFFRSAVTRRRIAGSASANSIVWPYLPLSRSDVHRW